MWLLAQEQESLPLKCQREDRGAVAEASCGAEAETGTEDDFSSWGFLSLICAYIQ